MELIVAAAENRVIGRAGRLPWHLPEDLAFFHAETAGQICVLGRICFETWPQARAGGRRPVVITRRHELADDVVRVVPDVPAALAAAEKLPGRLLICGGQRIYEECLALAVAEALPVRLHLTLVHAEVAGDVYFPEWRHLPWRELSRREGSDRQHRCTFLTLEL